MDTPHVIVRKLEDLTGSAARPDLGYAVESRDRPGPAHKHGAFPDDVVWVQLRGGLYIAKAHVKIGWVGEYSAVNEVRARTRGSALHDQASFWAGRPRSGYAAVAELTQERWLEPFWAGPRTYGYEWIVLESNKKKASWLEPREAPRSADDLAVAFRSWREARA